MLQVGLVSFLSLTLTFWPAIRVLLGLLLSWQGTILLVIILAPLAIRQVNLFLSFLWGS